MAEEAEVGCTRPAGGPVAEEPVEVTAVKEPVKEEPRMIMVGQKAPDFAAPGYKQGQFVNVN